MVKTNNNNTTKNNKIIIRRARIMPIIITLIRTVRKYDEHEE